MASGSDANLNGVAVQKQVNCPPNAGQLIESLRDTGYDFDSAIADIVDNSIDANATTISVAITQDPDGSVGVAIVDNGCGMSQAELVEAMTYGALPGKKNPKRLGHFGLGLKTSSTAFSSRLVVVSRSKGHVACKAVWDLDHVAKVNSWSLLIDEPTSYELDLLNQCSGSESGTVVVWDKPDRVLADFKKQDGAPKKKALNNLIASLSVHLGMVYQRFLDKLDTRARNIDLFINSELVVAWDPFQASNPSTELVANSKLQAELPDGTRCEFDFRAYVLPNKNEYEATPAGKESYLASRTSNDTQGIYLYREHRLIHLHSWLGMYSKEPHFSLLRAELSFGHELDGFFRIDIKKARIELNASLLDHLKRLLTAPRNAAEKRYREGQNALVAAVAKGAHDSSNINIGGKESSVSNSEVAIVDKESGTVDVTNPHGQTRIRLIVSESEGSRELHVKAVPTLDDGVLWTPAIINGHHAVMINTGHPYYSKVYVPNLAKSVTIQGMDALLWSICEAELCTLNQATKNYFGDLRREVSRILRELVVDLPDPKLDAVDTLDDPNA